VHRQADNIVNAPIAADCSPAEYRKTVEAAWLKKLQDFRPQLVLISAGFDGHRLDPMAELNLETEDYRWLTEMLVSVAHDHANDRIISTLEGGYHLKALAEGVAAHLEVLNAVY
jgi:acetoin utilization deacetylase AcuC-like enzyme